MSFKRITTKAILVSVILFFSGVLLAQERKPDVQLIENLVEELAQNSDEEIDYSQITEDLYYYFYAPLNLNTATTEDLENIHLLNPFQIQSIINYRQKHGALLSIYELQLIEGLPRPIINKLLPFVRVGEVDTKADFKFGRAVTGGRHELISRVSSTLERAEGYQSGEQKYPGNNLQFLNKYRYNYRQKVLWGITTEKDPGEQFLAGAQNHGFDFYSAYFQVKDIGMIKNITVGDYQMQLGQGLIMWSYISNGKSSLVLDTRKRAAGIKRYSSADENSFLRGGAASFKLSDFTITSFVSQKSFDANIVADTLTNSEYFTSFQLAGIHATPSQIENKDAVSETVYGTNLSWQKKQLSIGASWLHYQYNMPYLPKQTESNSFDFTGSENQNASINFDYRLKAIHFFGEGALSKNQGKALLAGALFQLNSQFNATVLYRNFERNFQAHFSNAFREGSDTQNEQGIYLGAEIYPYSKWKISGYYDFYNFPWLRSGVDAPSDGNDFLMQVDYQTTRNFQMYWRFKQERKQTSYSEEQIGLDKLHDSYKTTFRYHIDYTLNSYIKLRNRLEYVAVNLVNDDTETGVLVYQDVIFSFQQIPLKVNVRYALFDTESYDARIYKYESDVYQAYAIPAFYDKGNRTYLLLQYNPVNRLSLWFKIAQTYYTNRTSIGSGLNEIEGNKRTDVRFQLRYKF